MAGEAEVPKVSGVARKIGTVGVGQFLPGSTAFRLDQSTCRHCHSYIAYLVYIAEEEVQPCI